MFLKLFKSSWQLRLQIADKTNHAIIKLDKHITEFYSKPQIQQQLDIAIPNFEHQEFDLYLIVYLQQTGLAQYKKPDNIYLQINYQMAHNSDNLGQDDAGSSHDILLNKPVAPRKDYYMEILVIGLVFTFLLLLILLIVCIKKCRNKANHQVNNKTQQNHIQDIKPQPKKYYFNIKSISIYIYY